MWLWAVVAGLVAAGLWRQREALAAFDWALFGQTLRQLHPGWIGASWMLCIASHYARALRWAVFLRPVRPDARVFDLFQATTIGFTAIVMLGRPGELVRPYLIATKQQVPLASQFAAWLLERVYDLLMVLLLFGFALSQMRGVSTQAGSAMAWALSTGGRVAAVGGLLCLAGLIALGALHANLQRRVEWLPARFRLLAETFLEGLRSAASGRAAILLVVYSVMLWGLILACFVCMIRAFETLRGLGWNGTLILMGFVAFGSLVQIPGIGGGIQVVTVLVLRELFGVSLEVAGSAGITVWFITFVGVVPLGLWFAIREGLDWRKLRGVGAEGQHT